MKKKDEYTGDQHMVVLSIPKDTFKLKLTAYVIDDAKEDPIKVGTILKPDDLAQARRDYLSIDPEDLAFARFRVNQLFEQFLDDGGDINDMEAWVKYRDSHKDLY